MPNPLLSVVMPAFNAEKYVGEAIESILKQTFSDFEFIIINDGSTDCTAAVVESYKRSDSRISVFHKGNSGVADSMNHGCSTAKGKYIARMDADDISLAPRFAKQIAFLERNSSVGICGTWMRTFDRGGTRFHRYPTESDVIKSRLLFQLPLVGASIVFVRELFLNLGIKYNSRVGAADDYLFVVESSRHCQISSIPEFLYSYRMHPAQITKVQSAQQDRFGRQIRLSQLVELGINPTEDEVQIHDAIAAWHFKGDAEFVDRVESWLLKLKAANAAFRKYPEPIFTRVLSDYWFAACNATTEGGYWPFRRFLDSPFGSATKPITTLKLIAKCSVKGWL